jgi:hypothetical protein
MIVFDLRCTTAGHVFEAWFASSSAWEEQQAAGLVSCPFCESISVEKAVMAPMIARKGNRTPSHREVQRNAPDAITGEKAKAALSALAAAQQALLKNSTWVGNSFDEKARAMDAGEIATESIHGEVSHDQAKALLEDGVAVLPLPLPVIPPEKRN